MQNEVNVETNVICLSCAYVFERRKVEEIRCPSCGHAEDGAAYDSIMQRARDAVRFGYQYPARYAEDRRNGIEDSRYCLVDLPPVFAWAAIAALSGVVGNLTYDLIKQLIQEIAARYSQGTGESDPRLNRLLADDAMLEAFCTSVREYNDRVRDGVEDPDPAVSEERLVHLMLELTEEHSELYSQLQHLDGPERQVLMEQLRLLVRKKFDQHRSLDEVELEHIWNHVDLTG